LRAIGFLLRFYSYLFHLLLCLFLLGIALMASSSHQPLNLGMFPFAPEHMVRTIFILALAGLTTTILAITRVFKFLFPVWALLVFYWLFRGLFFSSYNFPSTGTFKSALWLLLGAFLASIGALWTLRTRRGRLYSS
jgi:LPXTG-motif cell wall-anchored protein